MNSQYNTESFYGVESLLGDQIVNNGTRDDGSEYVCGKRSIFSDFMQSLRV